MASKYFRNYGTQLLFLAFDELIYYLFSSISYVGNYEE
jgi:hypothetical protein